MAFSFELVRMFVAVAHAGSFSEAARRQGRSQSTVSTAVSNLEIDLGVQLFDRSNKEPVLTPAGAQLLRRAEVILDQYLDMQQQANNLVENKVGRVKLAIGVPHLTLVEILKDFAEQHPDIELDIIETDSRSILQALETDAVDLGIAFAVPSYPSVIDFVRLGAISMIHVAHAEHPLGRQKTASFVDLRGYRHIAFKSISNLQTSEYLRSNQIWTTDDFGLLLDMALAGLGWATVPNFVAAPYIEDGRLVELQLTAYPHTDFLAGVDLIWHKTSRLSPPGQYLGQLIKKHRLFM